MPIVTESEGSSTVIGGSGRGSSGSDSVSPIVISGMPATAMMSPALASLGADALQRLGHVELGDLDALDLAAAVAAPGDRLALADRALMDAADRDPADVRRRVEVGDVRLQRRALLVLRRGDVLDQQVEQRLQVGARLLQVERRGPGLGVGVDDREVDLRLVGLEVDEQLVDLVDHLA